jgi:hypothetical protein
MEAERFKILRMLEAGQIDAEGAAALLAALGGTGEEPLTSAPAPAEDPSERLGQQSDRFWIYPLMVGGFILTVGLLVVGLLYTIGASRGWLVCGWLQMILGVMVVLLAWWTRRARWLHLRISEGDSQKIAFSFPLPLTLAAWGLKVAQPFVPRLKETGVDDLIIAMRDSATGDQPLYIDVQDDEDGEHVELYIG